MKAMLPLARRSRLSVTSQRGSCISGLSICTRRLTRPHLHVVGARLMVKDDLVNVTVRHDFIGDARDVLRRGTLRNPDRPD